MNIEDLRARLAECDRANLELQYSFSEVSVFCEVLLIHKAGLCSQVPLSAEVEQRLGALNEKLFHSQRALEEIRRDIEGSLMKREDIERLLSSDLD